MKNRYVVLIGSMALAAAVAVPALGQSSGPTATSAASAKKIANQAKKTANKAQSTANAAQSTANAITGSSAYNGDCDPNSATFLDCVGVTLTLGQPGRVLVNASGGQVSISAAAPTAADGDCRLEVDDSTAGIPHSTTNQPGEATTDNTTPTAENGFANTAVTSVLPAGAHTFELSCNEGVGDQVIEDSMISAVRISG